MVNEDVIPLDVLEQKANNIFATNPPFDMDPGTPVPDRHKSLVEQIESALFMFTRTNN